jgi:hypothetical protein
MKNIFLKFGCLLILVGLPQNGFSQAAVSTVPAFTISANEAQNSVIYMRLPSGADGAIAFSGPDKIDTSDSNNVFDTGFVRYSSVRKEGQAVFFSTRMHGVKGEIGTVHFMTKHGRTISIVVISLGENEGSIKSGEVGAKIVITS